MKAIRAELKGENGELDDQKFDVIIVSVGPSKEMCRSRASHIVTSVTWRITISKMSER